MSKPAPSNAWIAAAVDALNRHGSWTGRVHVHKHLFLTKAVGLANPPFDYSLYQYGPYSYDLDGEIAQMELYGLLLKDYPKTGYGPKYFLSELGAEEARELRREDREALERVAAEIGGHDSQSLELQATCLWVQNEEGVQDDAKLIQRVRELKPKYDEPRIRHELAAVRSLISTLTS
jgi:uncharacterized protein YwgA